MDRLFGSGTDQLGLYALGRNRDLVGRLVGDVQVSPRGDSTASIAEAAAFTAADPASRCVPARVNGSLQPRYEGEVAVALNGRIAGLGPAYSTDDAGSNFTVLIRPDLVRAGGNDVELLLVRGHGDDRVLEPVTIAPE
jgi:hypothetical protein